MFLIRTVGFALPRAPQRTTAYIVIFFIQMYEIGEEINQELHRDFCLYSILEVYEISKEINQELHRGLLLIVLIKSV